jgi:hypothetical protein
LCIYDLFHILLSLWHIYGSMERMYVWWEVLHKYHSPSLTTGEAGHKEPRVAIGRGVKQWPLHKATLVLHSKLRNAIQHDTYPFLERNQYLHKDLKERTMSRDVLSEGIAAPHRRPCTHTHTGHPKQQSDTAKNWR